MKIIALAVLVIVFSITLVYFTDSWAYHTQNTIVAKPGDGHVVLQWGSSITADYLKFYIIRGNPTFDEGKIDVATVSASTRSYTIDGLTNGVEYEFFVESTDHRYNSWFAPVAATPGLPLAPNLTATESDGKLLLEWTQPDNGTGVSVTEYTLAGRVGDVNPFWTIDSFPASTTSYTVMDVATGVPYSFILQATGASGDKVFSNIATITLSESP